MTVDAPLLADDELADWLWLLHTAGLGRDAARRLLARLGTPQGVLKANRAQRGLAVTADLAVALDQPPEGHEQRLAATLAWRRAAPNRRVMVLGDPDYPPLLLNSADPPLLLYLEGRAELLNAPSLAIVGSRRPTPQGLDNARRFGRVVCEAGYTIVSGLAAGVDGAAHLGALDAMAAMAALAPGSSSDGDAADGVGQGASTVAVVGTGLDQVYPSSHRVLAGRIIAHGLMVSEFCLGTPPLQANFPMRNRLIAGLSQGTLVVEAALASGSLITARLAADAGREVMAMPGSVHSPLSRGCHALIRQGAALVESPDDVLAELGALPHQASLPLAASLAPTATARAAAQRRPAGVRAPTSGAAAARSAAAPQPSPAAPTSRRKAAGPGGPAPASASGQVDARPSEARSADERPAKADPVLQALGHDPATLDMLIARCGWPAAALSAHLLSLELDGHVARLPGGLYQRRSIG